MVIERNLALPLVELASKMPVVAVTGPRQSGKTTLSRHTFPTKPFVSFEPLDNRRFASEDPRDEMVARQPHLHRELRVLYGGEAAQ